MYNRDQGRLELNFRPVGAVATLKRTAGIKRSQGTAILAVIETGKQEGSTNACSGDKRLEFSFLSKWPGLGDDAGP